ncbi:MAG: biotin-dependent carboxyltransferase family protein [Colwellia sp.]|nr:biotin-dependent carboxyltransferase family protein [Colwellia sp.]
MLSLIQDAGRFGTNNLGLTNGGPVDMPAFYWANRLLGNHLLTNKANSSVIEISLGGLVLIAQYDSQIAVTGAPFPLTINGQVKELWRSYSIKAGDIIAFGFANIGVRCYLAIKGGFDIPLSFGSTSTVCREHLGGLSGNKLQANEIVPYNEIKSDNNQLMLAEKDRPNYSNEAILRTVSSYQQHHFSSAQQDLFYSSKYNVSKHYDRMGYRLNGPTIKAGINGILSEGICHGAIQIPNDGQPIVLLNDRQTIGGYPKIGAVIALDTAKLGQLSRGAKVSFTKISIDEAQQLFHSHNELLSQTELIPCD